MLLLSHLLLCVLLWNAAYDLVLEHLCREDSLKDVVQNDVSRNRIALLGFVVFTSRSIN